MKYCYLLFLLVLSSLFSFCVRAQNAPLEFIENRGQWEEPFLFKATATAADIYLEPAGITYLLSAADNATKIHDLKHGHLKDPQTLKYHAYRVHFEGGARAEKVEAGKLQKHYYNYFLGNDPSRWKSQIHPALSVDYKNLYPNIDLHFASADRMLKYDFIVHPGGDAGRIQLRFEGPDQLRLREGKLEIQTSVGTVTELAPYAYQYINGEKKEVPCRYKLRHHTLSFEFPKGYAAETPLVIDPTVVFATYSGSTADNWGFTATFDDQGNFYAGGIAADNGYPTTTGAFQTIFAGGGTGGGNQPSMQWDIAISKFNPAGNALIYSTYLGGADNEQPHSLIVDHNDNLVVAGRTFSGNFPTQNAYDNSYNGGADIIVTKFNATGTGLIGSTYFGGSGDDGVNVSTDWLTLSGLKHNYGDDARSEVIVDNQGNVYVAASTRSNDFPTQFATQASLQGGQDAVVFKLSPNLSTLLWSTYLGGSGDDAAYVLALDRNQTHLYVSGGTTNSNFPVTPGTYQPAYGGGSADGYILKFQNGGSYTLQRGTFIGMGNYDQCYGIQVDNNDDVYAMGQSIGGTFPVSAGVYSNPNSCQFIIKLDNNLTSRIYSTIFGSGDPNNANISPVAFLVDTCEQVYISGWGGNTGGQLGNVFNMPITPNAAQSSTDGRDFYFIVFSKNATSLMYATYYGSASLGEHVDGGTSRFDERGIVYQGICAGCGASSSFPTTPGAYSNTNNSGNCNYGALKISFDFLLTSDGAAFPDTAGCAPLTVNFSNSSINGTSFLWDFADGNTDTSSQPTHTFTTPGTYIVKLIAFNPNACNQVSDTDYVTIIVDGSSVKADFTPTIVSSCDPYQASFVNNSIANSGNAQFFWSFGDGTSFTGHTPPIHTYPDTGDYVVTLLIVDSTACNKRDSITKMISFSSSYVNADFIGDSVCIGNDILFANWSTNAQGYFWDFGDGNSSTVPSPTHTYQAPGTYIVTLVASHPGSCNKTDTATEVIMVFNNPYADFSYDPIIPEPNKPIQFTNKSKDATIFYWAFGDGTDSEKEHPSHLYKRTGRYKVCLQAQNILGCLHQTCKFVDAEIYPAIDVPTGFSPNGDGNNDILYVRGAAVETMSFTVYNRWGEKVFETNDMERGWDGTYKGKPQEMEAYAWVLHATFVDGTTVSRTGNVTLLR